MFLWPPTVAGNGTDRPTKHTNIYQNHPESVWRIRVFAATEQDDERWGDERPLVKPGREGNIHQQTGDSFSKFSQFPIYIYIIWSEFRIPKGQGILQTKR